MFQNMFGFFKISRLLIKDYCLFNEITILDSFSMNACSSHVDNSNATPQALQLFRATFCHHRV